MLFDLIEESKKIISIRSDQGTRELALHLAPFCSRLGFHVNFQAGGNGSAAREMNLIAYTVSSSGEGSGDLCPEGLLLATHLDTVPAGDLSLWTDTGGDPFNPVVREGRLYGLGSADTKLDFLCKLLAIEQVGLKNIKIPLVLAGTFGEERALAGARLIRESGIMHPRFALVGEPSNLDPVIGHKGILYMRAVCEPPPHPSASGGDPLPQGERGVRKMLFKGKASHGSMPHLGENAIEKGIQWLFDLGRREPGLRLRHIEGGTVHNIVPQACQIEVEAGGSIPSPGIEFLRVFFDLVSKASEQAQSRENPAFDPPRTTLNVGVIRTSPEGRIEIEFDFRLIPETDGNELFEILRGIPLLVKGARVEVIRSNAPLNTDPHSEVVRHVGEALKKIGMPVRFGVKSGNTEGAVFSEMGAETVVIGPGRSVGNIHQPNEFNEISQLEKAVKFYTAFLKQFC